MAMSLATVTVTFRPDLSLLEAQLCALPSGCLKIVVDNASPADLFAGITSLAARFHNVRVMRNDTNIGLAAAVNRGVRAAAKASPSPEFVLLLDQDSEPQPGSVEGLLAAFRNLEASGYKVGSVGPLLLDPETKLTHGFHQCTRWRWKRAYPLPGSTQPIPCANLNGSGTLVRVSLFLEQGGLDEPLFIDHVDTEWAFRLLAAGYTLWGVPPSVFVHRMGYASLRIWLLGWYLWPLRSPERNYYLFRNSVTLARRAYVPVVWKAWAAAKLAATIIVYAVFVPSRKRQLIAMIRGVSNGLVEAQKS